MNGKVLSQSLVVISAMTPMAAFADDHAGSHEGAVEKEENGQAHDSTWSTDVATSITRMET